MQPVVDSPGFAAQSLPPSVPGPSPLPPPPCSLTPGKDDTALLFDARIGFAHLLPGRPVLGAARPGDPPADAVVHLQDAPVTLRYVLTHAPVPVASAADATRATAEHHAGWRANARVPIDYANATWLAAWGVEAAAVASYDVADPPEAGGARRSRIADVADPPEAGGARRSRIADVAAEGADPQREDLFVLARQGVVLVVTWTYPRGFVDDPAYAAFASVAEATMAWDAARDLRRGRVWPESVFAGPGLYGRPKPKHNEAARRVASAPIPPDERAHLLAILASVVSGAGAPWVPLAPELVDGNRRAILAATRSSAVHAFVDAAFADVVTAHDLRGLAIMLGRALDGQVAGTTSSAPPPPPPPRVGLVEA